MDINISDDGYSYGLRGICRELNIKRAGITAVFAAFLQIWYLILFPVHVKLTELSAWILISASALYIIFMYFFRYCGENRRSDVLYIACIGYWCILFVLAGGCFFIDVLTNYVPASAMVTAALLITMLTAERLSDSLLICALFTLYNMTLCIIWSSGALYILKTAVVCIAFSALFLLQRKFFLYVVLSLCKESREDLLTGVLNRRGGVEKMRSIIELSKRHGKAVAVYIADVDDFKKYNDVCGHAGGDAALTFVARAISGVFVRSSDAVFRYGGEEFVICTSLTRSADADLLADKLVKAVKDLNIASIENILTVSVGYTLYEFSGEVRGVSAYEMIEMADKALYRAKKQGKNRAVLFRGNNNE